MVEHVAHLRVERRNLPDHEAADDEEAGEQGGVHDRHQERPGPAPCRQVRPRWSGPDRNAPTVQTTASPSVER